ncbi:MAG: EAL and HDOD domain-containing protein [Terriglobales bacterium]
MDTPAVKLVARQPIFDQSQQVFGYELLFRPDVAVNACERPKAEATLELIGDSLMLHELAALVDNRRAFVNVTRADLLAGHARYLPHEQVVIEVLESVEPDAEVLAALRELRRTGYTVALDDVTDPQRLEAFAGNVDIAKVDLSLSNRHRQRQLLKVIKALRIKAVAEKVETKAEFRELATLGFDFFQGYFFARPEVVQRRDAPAGGWSQLRLLQALHQAEFDINEVVLAIEQEPAFAYKLLRYLNSPTFGFRSDIHSIRHAITLLGEREVQRWVCIMSVSTMAGNGSPEVALTAVRRAMFCEGLAGCGSMSLQRDKLFLVGLLSTLDSILDRPRAEIVLQLPLDPEIAAALLSGESRMGAALRLVEAYDCAHWNRVNELAGKLKLSDRDLLGGYRSALSRSQQILGDAAMAPGS